MRSAAASPDARAGARAALLAAAQERRLPHAVLLAGAELAALLGVAREVLAAHLGAAVGSGHIDLIELRPSGKMRFVQVDAALEAVRFANLSSHSGRKAVLIHEADRLNGESANALLKTLEEPARGLLIVLVTTHPYRLLPTILSRCARFDLGGEGAPIPLPAWRDTVAAFASLARRAAEARGPAASVLVLEAYGILTRMERAHAELVARAIEADPFVAPPVDDAEEVGRMEDAHLARHERQLRARMLAELAESLRLLARERPDSAPGASAALACLEEAERRVHRLNVPAVAALERGFLGALRELSGRG
jgi:hypothetical protein